MNMSWDRLSDQNSSKILNALNRVELAARGDLQPANSGPMKRIFFESQRKRVSDLVDDDPQVRPRLFLVP
jgi:hypothetical protein